MSFSGRKFRRVACENVEQLALSANGAEYLERVLKMKPPIFAFTLAGDQLTIRMESNELNLTNTFTLGKEFEWESNDGRKVKVTYTLESDNVLHKVIKYPGGIVVHFRHEFQEKESHNTITIEGKNVEAKIYYEFIK